MEKMIEYTNGQFGAIAPARDVFKLIQEMHDLSEIKAVHIGTPYELSEIRQGKIEISGMHERLAEIEKEITQLRPKGAVKIYSMNDMPAQGESGE